MNVSLPPPGSPTNYTDKQTAGSPAHCAQCSIFRTQPPLPRVFRFLATGRPASAASCMRFHQSAAGFCCPKKKKIKNSLNAEMEKTKTASLSAHDSPAPFIQSCGMSVSSCKRAAAGPRAATTVNVKRGHTSRGRWRILKQSEEEGRGVGGVGGVEWSLEATI